MAFIRWLSFIWIVLALMLLGADIVSTLEAPGTVVVRSLDRILMLFQLDAKPFVEANFATWLVSPSLAVLASPSWATLGILGVLFSLLAQAFRSKPKEAHHTPSAEH